MNRVPFQAYLVLSSCFCVGACISSLSERTFGSGGTRLLPDEVDTGDASETYAGDGESPQINSVRAAFEDYPNIGTVIEVGIVYYDPQDDVEDGVVTVVLTNEDEIEEEIELDIDGSNAWIDSDDGEVVFAVSGADDDMVYAVQVTLADSSGNSSNTETTTTDG